MSTSQRKILIIYTGGTIGTDKKYKHQLPLEELKKLFPEIEALPYTIEWLEKREFSKDRKVVLETIQEKYPSYDGFVLLFGTGWLAQEATQLAYEIEGLNKPIIVTGSMKQAILKKSDAQSNLLGAVEIAARSGKDIPPIKEVTIFFNGKLMRATTTHKEKYRKFDAFVTDEQNILGRKNGENIQIYPEKFLISETEDTRFKPFEKIDIFHFSPSLIQPVQDQFDRQSQDDWIKIFREAKKDAILIELPEQKISSPEFHEFEKYFPDIPIFYIGQDIQKPNWIFLPHMNADQAEAKITYILNQTKESEMIRLLSEANLRGENENSLRGIPAEISERKRYL